METLQVELTNLNESIVFEAWIRNKNVYIISLYRSPSQTHDEFDNFFHNLTNKSYVMLLLETHFLFSWPAISMLEQPNGGEMIWTLMKVLKSIQLLLPMVLVRSFLTCSDPIHVLPNSPACIYLIFINQHPNGHSTSNQRRFDVNITSIRRKECIEEFPRYFHVFSDAILMVEKSTSCRHTFFDVISMD